MQSRDIKAYQQLIPDSIHDSFKDFSVIYAFAMSFTPFLVAISIACFAFYLSSMAKEEMVRIFAAILSCLSFIAGLILAPWFIQALLLIVVIVFWRDPVLR